MAAFQTNITPADVALPVRPMGLLAQIARLISLASQRRALAALDADQLDDLGLTRAEAAAEAARPIWDAPYHWTK